MYGWMYHKSMHVCLRRGEQIGLSSSPPSPGNKQTHTEGRTEQTDKRRHTHRVEQNRQIDRQRLSQSTYLRASASLPLAIRRALLEDLSVKRVGSLVLAATLPSLFLFVCSVKTHTHTHTRRKMPWGFDAQHKFSPCSYV